VRLIDAVVRSALDNTTAQKSTTHGDGPLLVILFEGEFSQNPNITGVTFAECIETKPKNVPPPRVGVQIVTTAVGSEKIFALLYDWKTPPPGDNNIVTPGTLTTAASGVGTSIDENKWLATADIPLTQVVPFATAPTDPDIKCQ
jgi:hypothetical protein